MVEDYFMGLDMGTNSVGWAVTDTSYRLIRRKGKDLWGIREFDEASTAEDRRSHRTSRRRIERRKYRIGCLKDYFADEINKVDPSFYQRLDNSFFKNEDKDENVRDMDLLFNDPDYNDKDFYKDYPTIFHLTSELIHYNDPDHQKNVKKGPYDVRMVFLAILNIYKHRGNFLNENLSTDERVDFNTSYNRLQQLLSDNCGISLPYMSDETADNAFSKDEFEKIMCDRGLSRSGKAERLQALLNIQKPEKDKIAIIKAICGLKADANAIFKIESETKNEFNFSESSYEEKAPEIEANIGEDYFDIITGMKDIYDTSQWDSIIKGYDYLCDSRVAAYDKHAHDLKKLKGLVKTYKPNKYDWFFRTSDKGTYGDYAASNNTRNRKERRLGDHKRDEFYAEVKKLLKEMPQENSDVNYIFGEIETEAFMPKILTSSNGVIPYQAHEKELKAILTNAEVYLPFLKEKDSESGLSVSEEIIEIFKFRIPYYVGPLNPASEKNGGNGWVVRKESGRVMPWNIDQKVDIKKTNEKFIERLIRKCTYISEENVLPKNSLIYERFAVLNEINNLRIDGVRIDVKVKQDIYNDLFLKGKSVSRDRIAKYLIDRKIIDNPADKSRLTGVDIKINSTLSSYAKFCRIFGEDNMKLDSYKKMAEDIVRYCTIYGDSKAFLKERLKEDFCDRISEEQLKKITALKFKDWGRISQKFLELSGCFKSTGEYMSLIDAMWETSYNMMELINSDEFTYKDELKKLTESLSGSMNQLKFEDLDEMYFSAPVKRMVWQTILVVKEISKLMGQPPKRLFIEMTRQEDEKKRTESRKDKFLSLYKSIKDDSQDWKKIIEDADKDGRLRSKKMYLYLMQMGRDMYTGLPIDLDKLFEANSYYDIDHVYPQSLINDDSLNNNMVLANKQINNRKQNSPVPRDVQKKCMSFWRLLKAKGLLSDEKFNRLCCTEFTDDMLAGFVERQMVETRQANKAVADILKGVLGGETEIVYSKAKVVSDFRKKFDIMKSRLANDFHHANDAYLNIVVGNAYRVKFTANPRKYIKSHNISSVIKSMAGNESNLNESENKKYTYNLAKFFERDVVNGSETAWKGSGKKEKDADTSYDNRKDDQGTIITVKKMIDRHTPLMTRLSFVGHGGISDQTLYNADKSQGVGYLPIKGNDSRMAVEKYGGFAKASTAYFFLVESEVKKKKIRTIETVPLYLAERIEKDPDILEQYCTDSLGLVDPDIRVRKIKIQSLVKWNGFFLNITGKTDKRLALRNSTNLKLNQNWINYIKVVENYLEKGRVDNTVSKEKNEELYKVLMNKHIHGIYSKRPNIVGDKLENAFDKFTELELEEQVKCLIQILHLSTIEAACKADLTVIGLSKATGVMKISKNVSGTDEFKLINQSVTGVYENSIDLLTV